MQGPDFWFHTHFLKADSGYGEILLRLGGELISRGYTVAVTCVHQDERDVKFPEWVGEFEISQEWMAKQPFVFYLGPPTKPMRLPDHWPAKLVWMTMWEASRIGIGAACFLSSADLVLTPSEWNAEVLRSSGVEKPIGIVPLATSRHYAATIADPPTAPFVFGYAGCTKNGRVRKNPEAVAEAFVLATRQTPMPDARLELKLQPGDRYDGPSHRQIVVRRERMSDEAMWEWYRSLSVFVNASRGEGWGMHLLDAMAAARPVITAPWGGVTAFWTEECGLAAEFELVPASGLYGGVRASWCEASVSSLATQMVEAYQMPRLYLRQRAAAAAARAAEFTWDRSTDALLAVLAEHGHLTGGPSAPPVAHASRVTA